MNFPDAKGAQTTEQRLPSEQSSRIVGSKLDFVMFSYRIRLTLQRIEFLPFLCSILLNNNSQLRV